jgi:hypothetical protein
MRDLSPAQVRQVWADYMGLVACVDHEVGRLLSALRRLGLHENTAILYTADHGKALGEWGATEKGFFDSEVWRVPCILAGPSVTSVIASEPPRGPAAPPRSTPVIARRPRDEAIPNGVISRRAPGGPLPQRQAIPTNSPQSHVDARICELVDTGRTLLGLAGLDAPAGYRGRDLLRDPPPPAVYGQIGWPDPHAPLFLRAFEHRVSEVRSQAPPRPSRPSEHSQMRAAVRTQRYRMDVTWYQDGARVPIEQADGNLFDLLADPRETRNLWAVPEARPLVHGLWTRLEEWFAGMDCPPELFSDA